MAITPLDLAAGHAELADELEQVTSRVLRSGRFLNGPELAGFEAEFADYCGVRAAVGVGSGFDALRLTLQALGIGAGDEVIVSAHTAVPTWLAITHTGARPVPAESHPDTMLIDPSAVSALVTTRTVAIVAVHLYGLPADMRALSDIARNHGLALVEDAAQAHGARLHGHTVGTLGRAAAFSFYPTKNLGAAGDAGMVVSDDEQLVQRVRSLANLGERDRHMTELPGASSRMDEIQAAILRVKLGYLETWNERRRARATRYLSSLADLSALRLPAVPVGAEPVWHQFVIRTPARERLRAALADRGIHTLVHYPCPPHRMPLYCEEYEESLPITEELAATVLSLPTSPQLTPAQCAQVCAALADCLAG